MTAEQFLDAGELGPAIVRLTDDLKVTPADLRGQTTLLELLCFAGDLDRAARQLDVIALEDGGPDAEAGIGLLRSLLAAERSRRRVFEEGTRPRFLLDPPPSVVIHLQILGLVREKRYGEARDAADRAASARGPIRGSWRGSAFEDFRDADDLLGPVLEVVSAAGYFWVPWEHVQYLKVSAPRLLRDLLWAPARLATFDGQLGEVFLPVLYPGTHDHHDDAVRLGRKTDWIDVGEGVVRGAGSKEVLVGEEIVTLLEIGEVQFSPPESTADEPDAAP